MKAKHLRLGSRLQSKVTSKWEYQQIAQKKTLECIALQKQVNALTEELNSMKDLVAQADEVLGWVLRDRK